MSSAYKTYKKAKKRGSIDYSYVSMNNDAYNKVHGVQTVNPVNTYTPSFQEVKQEAKQETSKRGILDRVFDVLSIGQYATQGFFTELKRDERGNWDAWNAFGGAWEGIKAGNPFGQGNEKGEYSFRDTLNAHTNWEDWQPEKWYGKTGKFAVELAGDILLDPLTYATLGVGTVAKGSGTKVGKEVIEEVTSKSVKEMLGKAGKVIDEDTALRFADKLNKAKGINTSKRGIGLFGNEIVSGNTLAKIGDSTIAPYVNKLRASIKDSSVMKLFNNSYQLRQWALHDPDKALRALSLIDDANKLKAQKIISNNEVRQFVSDVFKDVDGETQNKILDILENPEMWKDVEVFERVDDVEKFNEKVQNILSKEVDNVNAESLQKSSELEELQSILNDDKFYERLLGDDVPAFQEGLKNYFDVDNEYDDFQSMLNGITEDKLYDKALKEQETYAEHVAKNIQQTQEEVIPRIEGEQLGLDLEGIKGERHAMEIPTNEDVTSMSINQIGNVKTTRTPKFADEIAKQEKKITTMGYISKIDESQLVLQHNILNQQGVFERISKWSNAEKVNYLNRVLFGGESIIRLPKETSKSRVKQLNELLLAIKDGTTLDELQQLAWRCSGKGQDVQENLIKHYGKYGEMYSRAKDLQEEVKKLIAKKENATNGRQFNKIHAQKLANAQVELQELTLRMNTRNSELKYIRTLTDDEYRLYQTFRDEITFKPGIEKELDKRLKELGSFEAIQNQQMYDAVRASQDTGKVRNMDDVRNSVFNNSDYAKVNDKSYAGIDESDIKERMNLNSSYKRLEQVKKISKNVREHLLENFKTYFKSNNEILNKSFKGNQLVDSAHLQANLEQWLRGMDKNASMSLDDVIEDLLRIGSEDEIVIHVSSDVTQKILDPFKKGDGIVRTLGTPIVDGLPEKETYYTLVAPQMKKKVFIKDALTGETIMTNVGQNGVAGYMYSVTPSAKGNARRFALEKQRLANLQKTYDDFVNKNFEVVIEENQLDSVSELEKEFNEFVEKLPSNATELPPHVTPEKIKSKYFHTRPVSEQVGRKTLKEENVLENIVNNADNVKVDFPTLDGGKFHFDGKSMTDLETGEIFEFDEYIQLQHNFDPYYGRQLQDESVDNLYVQMKKQIENLQEQIYRKDDRIEEILSVAHKEDVYREVLEQFSKEEGSTYVYKDGETFVSRLKKRIDADDVTLSQDVKEIAKEVRQRLIDLGVEEQRAGKLENLINTYAPHVLNPELKNNPHIMQKLQKQEPELYKEIFGSYGEHFDPFSFSRSEEFANKFGYSVREVNDAIRPMLKRAGFDGDFFINQIGEAYLTRALTSNEVLYGTRFVDQVLEDFGKKVTPETIQDGKKYFLKQDNIRDIFKNASLDDEAQKRVLELAGFNVERTYNKNLIEVTGKEYRRIVEAFGKNFENFPTAFELPEYFANSVQKLGYTQLIKETNGFLKLYDKVSYLWKTVVTSPNPGFHIRNKFSNVFQNYLNVGNEVFNTKTRMHTTGVLGGEVGELITNSGKVIPYDDIRTYAEVYGVLDDGFFTSELKGKVTKGLNLNPLDADNNSLYETGRKIGNKIETRDRMLNFIANLKNDLSFEEAGEMTNKFLFDYEDLTLFEKNFCRRIIPFYTWIKKNASLQIEQLINNPGAYRFVAKATNELNEGEDMNAFPEFMQDWVRLPIELENGDGLYLNPNMPYGAIGDVGEMVDVTEPSTMLKRYANMTNPIIKVPLELATNYNTYFKDEIYNENGEGVGDYLMGQTGVYNSMYKILQSLSSGNPSTNDLLNAFSFGTGIKVRADNADNYTKSAIKKRLENGGDKREE